MNKENAREVMQALEKLGNEVTDVSPSLMAVLIERELFTAGIMAAIFSVVAIAVGISIINVNNIRPMSDHEAVGKLLVMVVLLIVSFVCLAGLVYYIPIVWSPESEVLHYLLERSSCE